MAGSRVKGITIEIGANTVKLTDQLKAVDKSLKSTQDSLKDVNKLLKFDPKNTELLRQKQELLGKAIKDTEKKLDEEREALKQLVAKDDGTEKAKQQQDALRREIESTEISLRSYKKQLAEMPNALDRVADATGKVAEKTKLLSQTAGAGALAILGNAVGAGKTADELNTLARNTGISVEELQRMQYASALVDVSVDQMTGAYKKLVKQMGSGASVFADLGVEIYDASGNLRDANDVFYEALDALAQIDNETERDAKSMELFGKSAMDLSGIIDDGGQALREYGDEAENAGLIMSKDLVDSANELQDQIDRLKGTTQLALTQAGASLAGVLAPALETIVQKISVLLQWFAKLDGETQKQIVTILAVVASISPLFSIISKVSGALKTLQVGIGALSSPIGIAMLAITALVGAGILLYTHWEELKAYAEQLRQNLSDNFNSARDAVVGAFNTIIQWAVELPSRVANGILEQIYLVKSSAEQLGQSIVDKLSEFFGNMKQVGLDFIEKIKDGIGEAWDGAVEYVKSIGQAIVDGVWSGITGAIGTFTENVRGFFSGIVTSVKNELGIRSPSKVFAYIGEMMGDGLVQGWDDSIRAFNPNADIMAVTGGAMLAGGVGGNSYGITNNVNLYGAYHERDGMNIALSIDKWMGARI